MVAILLTLTERRIRVLVLGASGDGQGATCTSTWTQLSSSRLTTSMISWAHERTSCFVVSFEHHAQQRLGAGIADRPGGPAVEARFDRAIASVIAGTVSARPSRARAR
jgi:hypothetical protein